ncbi:MAG: hypothetical protein ACR2FY_08720 [Pirellulaceae bacterium]
MYDSKIGQWLTEDPDGFPAGDTNLGRYVGNHPTYATDPTGLIEAPAKTKPATKAAGSKPPNSDPADDKSGQTSRHGKMLTIPIIIIDMTTRPKAGKLSDDIVKKTNEILKQCDVFASKRGIIFPGRPGGEVKSRITFDARTHQFSGGGWAGKSLKKFLNETTKQTGVVFVIIVDEITGSGSKTFGLTYGPDNKNGTAIVLAVNLPPNKLNDTPERTLAHECANYFGLKDRDRSGIDGENLMSYGKWSEDGLIRGTKLDAEQIRQIREGIDKVIAKEKLRNE